MRDLAKVGYDGWLGCGISAGIACFALAPPIAREGRVFDAAVDAGLLKSLERSGLRMSQSGFDTAFGKNPAAAASLNQQEFNTAHANAVTDCCHLLPSFQGFSGEFCRHTCNHL